MGLIMFSTLPMELCRHWNSSRIQTESGILVKKAPGFTFLICNLKLHCWYHSFLRSWQDEWVLGLKDTPFNISSTSIHVGNDNLPVIEIQTFLENWSIITADGVKRCNVCYIFKELHNNILSMHTSDCLSQVSTSALYVSRALKWAKNLSNIRQRFSCLLDEWIAKKTRVAFS